MNRSFLIIFHFKQCGSDFQLTNRLEKLEDELHQAKVRIGQLESSEQRNKELMMDFQVKLARRILQLKNSGEKNVYRTRPYAKKAYLCFKLQVQILTIFSYYFHFTQKPPLHEILTSILLIAYRFLCGIFTLLQNTFKCFGFYHYLTVKVFIFATYAVFSAITYLVTKTIVASYLKILII